MGQRIEIEGKKVVDESVIVSTNRSLTGTDGEGYSSAEDSAESETFGGRLAQDLFEADTGVDRVYVASNAIVIRRGAGWESDAGDNVAGVIEEFFRHY